MPKVTRVKKKKYTQKSQEIVFKEPSLFRKVVSFITAYSMMLWNITPAFATNISGVSGNNGVYDIEAAKISGNTGFRQYTDFTLDNGDVANLQFKKGSQEYGKFVNLVDNQVNINGIVNTVKGDAFYNGHAIFVSPNGIVVGASGVLNVGALTMVAPNSDKYDDFKDAFNDNDLSDYVHGAEKYNEVLSAANGDITINGKIISKGDVELYGKNITIEGKNGKRAGVVAGVESQGKITTQEQAKQVFDTLVSNNINNVDSFSLEGGKIKIKAGSTKATDSVKSAKIDVKNADLGANEVDIKAEVESDDKIDMVKTEISVEDNKITADKIDIKAESKRNHTLVLGDNDYIQGLNSAVVEFLTNLIAGEDSHNPFAATGASDAKITVKNSVLRAIKEDVAINAFSSFSIEDNVNLMKPALLIMLIDLFRDNNYDSEVMPTDASFTQFFDSDIYEAFDGPRTRAEVTVNNSDIAADSGNIAIETDAFSALKLSTGSEGLIIPVALYGFGTGTVSRAIVKNHSKLTAKAGNVNVDAFSDNKNEVSISNTGITSFAIEDFFILAIVNNAVKTTTEARVEDSTVETKDLRVRAVNHAFSDIDLTIETLAGMSSQEPQDDPQGQTQGNSAVSGVGVLHRSDNNVSAIIKNSTVTSDNTTVLAQSLNVTSNSGDASVDDPMVEKPRPYRWMQWERNIYSGLKNIQRKYINKSIFNRIKGGGNFVGQQGATAEVGGVFVWSNTQNKAVAKIENSTVKATGDVSVQANTIDVLENNATADTAGEEKFSLTATVIINDEENTTEAKVSGATVNAKNLTVNATTEMPMNEFELIFGLKFPFKINGVDGAYFGGTFGHEANGKWDVNAKYPDTSDDATGFDFSNFTNKSLYENYENMKPKLRWSGLFNNFAQTNGIGKTIAAAFSVIYNEVTNNTTATLANSDVTLNAVKKNDKYEGGNLIVNAVNSVIGYNALGMVDFFIRQINYYIPGQVNWGYEPQVEAGKFGLGFNFLWDIYTNNATANVDNSKVNTQNGDATVSAANEQEYVTLQVTGGKTEVIGIDGSVNVQKINGSTLAQVLNGSEITAENIEINAGKATIETAGGEPEINKDTKEAELNDEREAEDAMTIITFMPSWTVQNSEMGNNAQSTSSGVAVGASVDVMNIDRTVKAKVSDSTLKSGEDTNVAADTYSQILNIVGAAAWSGGVTPPEPEENVAGHDIGNANENAQNAQDNDDENMFGNLFDGEEDFMQAPVGNALTVLRNKFSLSVAGALMVLNDNTNAKAEISGSDLNIGNDLNVLADRETRMITISGGLSKSGKVGVGAAVDIYKSDGSVKANISDSSVKFTADDAADSNGDEENSNPRLKVNAHNINKFITIAIGAGLTPGAEVNDESLKAAIGGSYNKNTLKPEIEASIQNSTIETDDDEKKPNITVNAENDVTMYNIAGGGVYMNSGSSSLGVGAAINYNNIKHIISAYIKNSELKNVNKVSVSADTNNNLNDFAVAGSLAFGLNTSGFTFDGGAVVDYIHDTLAAKILGSTVEAAGDIIVKAASDSGNLGSAGTFDINLTNGGMGVNGDLVVNVFRNDVTAEIGNSYNLVKKDDDTYETVLDRQSKILKAKDVKVSSASTEKSNVIAIGGAVGTGGQFIMAAANVGVNLIDNSVKAYLGGAVGTGDDAEAVKDVTVAAYDETTLYSRGGTVSAVTNADALVAFAGAVNVDKIDKTVEAKIENADIKATGDVSATASSINSLGGTKNDENEYTSDDVTTEAYREKMLHKNANDEYDGLKLKNKEDSDEYIGLDQDSDFWNWNMFYDIAAGYKPLAISGTGVGKVISNTVTAEIIGSKIEADSSSVIADDYSIKNIIAGTISGSGKGSVGLQVLYTRDDSTTSALINGGSELNITRGLNIEANNRKDNHQILIVGSGAQFFAVNGNAVINNITDKTIAKIDNGTTDKEIKAGILAISADEFINASHIVVAGAGAQNVAVNISPTINSYNGTVEAAIKNAKIKDAAIDMDANSKIDTLDVDVGFSGTAQGLAGVGLAIKNKYTNNVEAYIDSAKINTARNIFIDANSVIDSTNWLVGIDGTYQGTDITVNVLLNNINSKIKAGIKNSTIEKSGAITINTNKDKKDKITNRAIAAGALFQGATLAVNVIKNVYENENAIISYVEKTSSEPNAIDSLSVNAYSDRRMINANVGIGVTGEGGSLLANATVNEIGSTVRAYVDAKSKTLNIANALSLESKDFAAADNTMGMIASGIYGGALGINVDLYYSDNLVKSEILSSASGQINAGSASLKSEVDNAHNNTNIDLTFGGIGVPVDVQIIELGKRAESYSDVEKKLINKANSLVPTALYDQSIDTDKVETGAISRVKGNLETADNIQIKAQTQLRGIDKEGNITDKYKTDNTHVTVAGGELNVGVRRMNIAGNTIAEISDGKVESTDGDVSLEAKSKVDVEINNTAVEVGGVQVSGRSLIYNNLAKTTAQIIDATVNAQNIELDANSNNKAYVDATGVVVSIGGVVTVDLVEVIDTNKTTALITGETDIDADGKLTLHANTTSDLTSWKTSVPVQIADVVGVSRNRVESSSVAGAVIEEVNGTINVSGLDIITDYDKMYTYSKSNIVAVKPIDIASYDDSGSFMNATFKSGIDSADDLILKNTGTTNIITARDNQADGSGMQAIGNIHNVHVSFVNFYTGAFSKAENTATSSTILKAKDHMSNNLNIEQYLNSSAIAEAGNTKVTLLGTCAAVSADAKDTSTLEFDIGGSNTVVSEAIINATHKSKIKSDLSNFNLGVIVSGGRIRIDSYLTSNTIGNIGGDFNAGNAVINVNTIRDSNMSKGSGSGGFINISDTEVSNTIMGDSILNIKNAASDVENINNWRIANKSENIFDVETTDGSGGFLNVSLGNIFTYFETSTETNIEKSNINSSGKIKLEVDNKAVFKDSAWSNGGGVISVINNYTQNNYKAGAKLSIKDTKIKAGDLELDVSSDMRTSSDDYVSHSGGGGGLVAVSYFTLINNLTQAAEIDIQNSELSASRSAIIQALTSSRYKQKMDADFRGLVAVPRFSNTLDVNNTEKLTLDDKSKITAGEELDINFNSNNNLAVRTFADARNFEGVPAAWAYLYLTINNILENSGSLTAGNLVDIKFMNKSTNDLTQYAHTENDAFIASTTEDGVLSRIVNNTLNVNSNADITSGKDVNISYSTGTMKPSSEVSWVTNSLWFIEDSGSTSKDSPSINYTLKNDGEIIAGQGNSRYMKINRDGTVDEATRKGFYDDDYVIYDGQSISGQSFKDNNLVIINNNINNVEEKLTELEDTITDITSTIEYFTAQREPAQAKLIELNNLLAEGYILIESESDTEGNSDFNTLLQNDIDALLISEEDADKLTQAQYDTMMNDYVAKLSEISTYNYGHSEKLPTPTITEFLGENNYGLTEAQIKNIRLHYGFADEVIIGDDDTQISQDKYNEISNAYRAKLVEINEYNFGHTEKQVMPTLLEFLDTQNYGFTEAQINSIETTYNTVEANLKLSAVGQFTTYENASGKYLAVKNLTVEGDTSIFSELRQLNGEIENLTNQINAYEARKTANEATKTALINQKALLTVERERVLNTDADDYTRVENAYSIVFNDIDAKNASINVDGAYNSNISGSGEFKVASGGVKIDNYSTRSLMFNHLNVDSETTGGLFIGGKNHFEFADKPQAVSGVDAYYYLHPDVLHPETFENLPTEGVHYVSGDGVVGGITINNWYDINHPQAESFDIPHPTTASNIFFNGNINTSLLNVLNESGDITSIANIINAGIMNLYATNGQIGIIMHNQENDTAFNLSSGSNMFAAAGISINADNVDIKGNVKTGYSDRSITITEEMLQEENLVVDPTSGEKNLINLGGDNISPYLNATNNIKAIYKEGQIYLYNMPESTINGGLKIAKVTGDDAAGSISGTVTLADGYKKITVDNKTAKQLNIKNINNVYFEGALEVDGIDTSDATITRNTKASAQTDIKSKDMLAISGIIRNNVRKSSVSGSYMVQNINGELNITAGNGLIIAAQTAEGVSTEAILAGGLADITINGGDADIAGDITDKGNIKIYNFGDGKTDINGKIKDTRGDILVQNDGAGKLTVNGEIINEKGNISILGTGIGLSELNNAVTANEGDIFIASKGLNITEDAVITDKKGDISIINNAGELEFNGLIAAYSGDVNIENNGTAANLAGFITDEEGDLIMLNNKGDMTIASEIYHNYVKQNSAGQIAIINGLEGGLLDIQNTIQTWGIGKTETDIESGEETTTAILIDNQSTANGMDITKAVSARVGDIIIKNAGGKLTSGAEISNTEEGGIFITNSGTEGSEIAGKIITKVGDIEVINNAGNDLVRAEIINQNGHTYITNDGGILSYTGSITGDDGDVVIANKANAKQAQIGGIITNKKGNTTISNDGKNLTFSGTIDNRNGSVNIIGSNVADTAFVSVVGQITNKGGNVVVNNLGSYTEISGKINNTDGSISVSNKKGNLTVKNSAVIENTADNADNGVTITNADTANILRIAGDIESLNKGNIDIINNGGGNTVITGDITAHDGNINIENNNAGNLLIEASSIITEDSGDIDIYSDGSELMVSDAWIETETDGDITIVNEGDKGTSVSGDVVTNKGDIAITNDSDKLQIAADISTDKGVIDIDNYGGALVIADDALITTETAGNININNQGSDGTSIAGGVTAAIGNITVSNAKKALNISGDIAAENGNIDITNNSEDFGTAIVGDVSTDKGNITIENNGDKLVVSGDIAGGTSYIDIESSGAEGAEISGNISTEDGNMDIHNTGGALLLTVLSDVSTDKGNIALTNSGEKGAEIAGSITNTGGNTSIDNQNGGLLLATDGRVVNTDGDIKLHNTGTDGLTIVGKILAQNGDIAVNNVNSDLTVGEYAGNNDNYIEAVSGDVVINQTGGNVLNGVSDPLGGKHQNADLAEPEHSYKTLIVTDGNLIINVVDGNIGATATENAGYSIDASTRDWTDSVNVGVAGNIIATAVNDNNTDARLINLRAKYSDLNVKNITADGNVMLTAADWKQADARPTPDDEAYSRGYSIVNRAQSENATVTGRNISLIASDNIGTAENRFTYMQDTAANPQSAVSFEGENDLYIVGDANSDAGTNIYQFISKQGSIELDLNKDTVIEHITAEGGLEITQKAQNLTIYELGIPSSSGESVEFDDILYPHDDLIYGECEKGVVPQYVILRALDAIDSPERGDSNLKVYSMNVRGNNGDNADYYPDGGRLADVTLMADNIYINSDKAPGSTVVTKDNPQGHLQTGALYFGKIPGLVGDELHPAKGVNSYGDGTPLSFDILGVDRDVVADFVKHAQRNEYIEQTSVKNVPSKFHNDEDSIYDYDFRAKNVVISINDYVDTERGVELDTLYADNAYINTLDTNLIIHDGYINDYAELRNGNRDTGSSRYLGVIDNDYRRLVPSNIQLYSIQTGSFGLSMNEKIKLHTPAPVVHYDWDKLANTFSDENSFVRLGLKETELRQRAKDYFEYGNIDAMSQNLKPNYEVWQDSGLLSNVKILEIDRIGAVIINRENWQPGEEHELELRFDDVNVKLICVVTKVNRNLATVKFTNMPASVVHKLTYRYMKTVAN